MNELLNHIFQTREIAYRTARQAKKKFKKQGGIIALTVIGCITMFGYQQLQIALLKDDIRELKEKEP